MPDLKIEYLPTASLSAYARNSRTHAPEQVAQIAASIKEFGFTNPILIDERGEIIAGHGRIMAALSIAIESVPCIRLTHLTDAQRRAYVIADNQLPLNAGWDAGILSQEISDLIENDFDIDLLGFADIDFMLTPPQDELNEMPELDSGDKQPFQQMTFTVHDTQAEIVIAALSAAKKQGPFVNSPNENSNGNALARICARYIGQ